MSFFQNTTPFIDATKALECEMRRLKISTYSLFDIDFRLILF
jgi:hypothetical protein